VVVGLSAADASITISQFYLFYEKRLTGSIYGSVDPEKSPANRSSPVST
jgi:Zn-dependent alcohol dehydrogenase